MRRSHRSFLALALCAMALAGGAAGCDWFNQLFGGDTSGLPVVVQGSILVVMQNESGLHVDVDASFLVKGVVVRETRRTLTPTGPESVRSILRTTAERIEVVARLNFASATSGLAAGTVLRQAVYLLDVDYVDGSTIYFVVPAQGGPPTTENPEDDCIDQAVPSIHCPPDAQVECGASLTSGVNPALPIATASDDCDSSPNIASSDEFSGQPCAVIITRTWTATDDAGKTASCEQSIAVSDSTPPEIDVCPEDDELPAGVGCSAEAPDYRPQLLSGDACTSQPVVEQSPAPGTALSLGETEVTFTVIDDCQNYVECTMTLTVASPDSDGDNVPDCADQCDGYDDNLDCNNNGVPDGCDIANCDGDPACGDCDGNGVPDGCEYNPDDCNNNGVADGCEIAMQLAHDLNNNGTPDECDLVGDLNGDGELNGQDVAFFVYCWHQGTAQGQCALADLNNDGVVDHLDLLLFIQLFFHP